MKIEPLQFGIANKRRRPRIIYRWALCTTKVNAGNKSAEVASKRRCTSESPIAWLRALSFDSCSSDALLIRRLTPDANRISYWLIRSCCFSSKFPISLIQPRSRADDKLTNRSPILNEYTISRVTNRPVETGNAGSG
jgi:hypothetical protein